MVQYFADVMMFENLNIKNKSTAMAEILTMLVGSFLLGFLLHWLICRGRDHVSKSASPVSRGRSTTIAATARRKDDLKIIEGVGPKIESLLNEAGIMTFAQMARTPASKIKAVLSEAGPRFQVHNPASWIEQAELARDGKMAELDKLKDRLTGGRA